MIARDSDKAIADELCCIATSVSFVLFTVCAFHRGILLAFPLKTTDFVMIYFPFIFRVHTIRCLLYHSSKLLSIMSALCVCAITIFSKYVS